MKATIALSDTVRVVFNDDGSLDLEAPIIIDGAQRMETVAHLTAVEVGRLRVLLSTPDPESLRGRWGQG
jgi:hypothetical protein